MKKIFNSFLIVAIMASVASISSCTKVCDAGFEGSDCKTEMRAKFLSSNYSVTEIATVSGSFGPYNASITSSSTDVKKIFFNNFGDFTANITEVGTVDATNSVTIAAQTVSGYTINGSGTMSGTTLTISYSVSAASGGSETSVATWHKL